MTRKALCVDDDANILAAHRRQLRNAFKIDTAQSGQDGLKALDEKGPYPVIVSDLRMPGMDGIEFLSKAREKAPDSVRIMLTGNADLEAAIEVVNEGGIFRFLTKPCSPASLLRALNDGVSQYCLIKAERERVTTVC